MTINWGGILSAVLSACGQTNGATAPAAPSPTVATAGAVTITAANLTSFVATAEAVVPKLKTLIADPGNGPNDKDLAEQVAAIAATILIPEPIERELALAIFDLVVSNMQSPALTGADMASPYKPDGSRYFGR